jgi:hypothetical protein
MLQKSCAQTMDIIDEVKQAAFLNSSSGCYYIHFFEWKEVCNRGEKL